MKTKDALTVVGVVLMVLVPIIGLTYFGTELGFTSAMIDDLITMLPGVILFCVGAFMVAMTQGVFAVGGFGVLGLAAAMLVGYADTAGYITAAMLSGLTVAQVQIFCVVIFLALGGVVGALTRGR